MTISQKPYAESCDENAPPILEVLSTKLPTPGELLEIGSGTGQHAIKFARALPNIVWHTSDMSQIHHGIQLWLDEARLPNLRSPYPLNVVTDAWPKQQFDAAFSANTAHIMSMDMVEGMFRGIASILKPDAPFLLYGPFIYDDVDTCESNILFDSWLRSRQPHQGIRHMTWLKETAKKYSLYLDDDIEMPANNRILIWRLK